MRVTQLITMHVTSLPCTLHKTLKYSSFTVCNDIVCAQQNTLIRLSTRARKDPFSEGMQNKMWTEFNAVARRELFLRKLPKNLIKIFLKSLKKKGLILKERICSLWEQILSFKSSPYGKEAKYLMLMSLYCKYFPLHVTHMRNMRHMRNCVISPTPMELLSSKVYHFPLQIFESSFLVKVRICSPRSELVLWCCPEDRL